MTTLPAPATKPFGKYYAIELKETQFKYLQDTGDTAQIVFRWADIVTS